MRDNCADIFVENAKAAHQAAEYCAVWSDEVDCRQPPPLANLQGLHERMRDNAAVLPRFFRRDDVGGHHVSCFSWKAKLP
eukprot:scaffold204364_cov21-Tisochrysis_lutea.AAC.1